MEQDSEAFKPKLEGYLQTLQDMEETVHLLDKSDMQEVVDVLSSREFLPCT
jgi:hypothetical protein